MVTNDTAEQPHFEDLLRQFDEAVTSLESDGLSLEAALSKYESAVQLAEECARMLKSAELRIVEIGRALEDLDRSTDE